MNEMTKKDAERIREAAIIMLHVIKSDLGDTDVFAALRFLPPPAESSISLSTARDLLEATPAWKEGR